ncbi:winged helix-turn-helix DNA-binding domain, heat shock transcription factor family protein [Tanacetum coccineum]
MGSCSVASCDVNVVIAKKWHFEYSTPKKIPAFRCSLNLEEFPQSNYEDVEAPNAPKQSRKFHPGLSRKNMAAIRASLIDVEETMLASDISEGFSSGDDEGLLAEEPIRGVRNGVLPPFVNKLYNTVCNKETDSIISWVPNLNVTDGAKSFAIWNIDEFINNVLPLMSKSTNFDSFITQLHNYVRILSS